MQFFAKAVLTGFALSLGAALFKKVSKQIGLDDKTAADAAADKNPATNPVGQDGATDPGLKHERFS
jgi:hypothetical protein